MQITEFSIDIGDELIAELKARLRATRWPDAVAAGPWSYGAEPGYMRELCEHWAERYDWPAAQRRLNERGHYTAEIAGTRVHFVHERSANEGATPLLLLHGWPSSFVQMLPILPLLADDFHVVVPSLPGYGFSARPAEPGMSVVKIAGLLHALMSDGLGYTRYATRGTDLGAGVLQQLALSHPDSLIGVHQGGTNPYVAQVPEDLSDAEKEFVANAARWTQAEMAYAQEHSTKPQTLAYALNDSPIGLAAWIIEKFHTWSDGELARVFDRDDLLTNVTIYWATQTIGSSIRLYYETAHERNARWGRVEVPTAMAMTKDMFPTPREWVERSYNVVRWTQLPRGGHFPEWEVPELLAPDIKAFYRELA